MRHPVPPPPRTAWQALLEAALRAAWPTDRQLEEMLDRYERLP
ncbi:MAG: hypothetical protein ACU0CO_06360 [Shimia sp.]